MFAVLLWCVRARANSSICFLDTIQATAELLGTFHCKLNALQ